MRSLFVVSGAMGSGKSTAATYLDVRYGFKRIAFADELKRKCKLITPDGQIDKSRDRSLLQFIGTEYYRKMDENYWVNIAVANINEARDKHQLDIVVDDCRFENEFEALNAIGAVFIHVLRDEQERHRSLIERDGELSTGIAAHASELPIGELYANQIVYNNGKKEQFVNDIDLIYELYRERVHG